VGSSEVLMVWMVRMLGEGEGAGSFGSGTEGAGDVGAEQTMRTRPRAGAVRTSHAAGEVGLLCVAAGTCV
jgi:hypothetical protein